MMTLRVMTATSARMSRTFDSPAAATISPKCVNSRGLSRTMVVELVVAEYVRLLMRASSTSSAENDDEAKTRASPTCGWWGV